MPWIVGGAILGSGMLGTIGAGSQQRAANDQASRLNDFNAEQANLNRYWSAQQAQLQMQFQERMSSTGYQRATRDMLAADLNPMLAYSQGPASSPGGAAGAGAQASGVQAPQINRLASAAQAVGQLGTLSQQAAQTDQIRAQTSLIEEQRSNIQADTRAKISSSGHLDALEAQVRQEMQSFTKRMEKLGWETRSAELQSDVDVYRQREASARDNFARERAAAEARQMIHKAELLGLEIPRAVAEAALWKSMGETGSGLKFGAETLQKIWPMIRLGR